jgi:N-acetylmuramoyl-L-alanine amidase
MSKQGTIVLDPGHGGSKKIDYSSAYNATSPSGVLEKTMTLDIARLTREALQTEATVGGHTITVVMTRDADVNLGLSDRATVAKTNDADLLLSLHFNAMDKKARAVQTRGFESRGVESWVYPQTSDETTGDRLAADTQFAVSIQQAAFTALQQHDAETKNRHNGKPQPAKFGVLDRTILATKTKACLLEIEFIDVPAVDELLNTGADSATVRADLATAMAKALIDSLP